MGHPGDLSYRFHAAGHWGAGAIQGFEAGDGGLAVAAPRVAERIAESEEGTIAAAGPCGRLLWLRANNGELVELHQFGPEPQGRIRARRPSAIHPGPSLLWVRGGERLYRYAARTLQELGEVRVPGLVASAADGCDGLWLLVRGGDGASVRRIAANGLFEGPPIALRDARDPVAIASDPARRRLAVLDAPAQADPAEAEWRLHLVELASCEAREPFRFALAPKEAPPRRIAVDPKGNFHLASATVPASLIGVSADGVETSRQKDVLLPDSRAVQGLAWNNGLVLACDDGLYRLRPAREDDDGVAPTLASFITPTLMSPPGTPGGWNRAEIAVELPRGAGLRATVFASSSEWLARDVEEKLAATEGRPAARFAALKALFAANPASEVRSRSYEGEGAQDLHLLLDQIAHPYLWLQLEITCPAGAGAASIGALRVRYPDRSWIDELPAIYRDQPGPARQLRQFLAPFEALFTGLDETIGRLPAGIDPETAGDDRLGWLLGWLGFPPTAGLPARVQRDLLKEAGSLLEGRGTLQSLSRLLEIVTGARASVVDGAAAAGFWVIANDLGRLSPRLGRDTRAVARLPAGFRPGTGIRLGEEPLPPLCTDLGRVLRANCARVAIRIAVDPAQRDVVLPIVDSLLAMFVPAHCAIDLDVARTGRTPRGGQIDRAWRLADEKRTNGDRLDDPDATELGWETEAGAWRLPCPDPPPFAINSNAALDGVRRLA